MDGASASGTGTVSEGSGGEAWYGASGEVAWIYPSRKTEDHHTENGEYGPKRVGNVGGKC